MKTKRIDEINDRLDFLARSINECAIEKQELEDELTELYEEKDEFSFGGVLFGKADGWNGDHEWLMFNDLEPSNQLKTIFPDIPNGTIAIHTEKGILEVYSEDGQEVIWKTEFTICPKK